jgi:hypothetical protein
LPVNNALIGKSSFHRVQAINSEIPELFVPWDGTMEEVDGG